MFICLVFIPVIVFKNMIPFLSFYKVYKKRLANTTTHLFMMVADVSSFIRINVFEVYYELYSFVSYLISLFSIFSGYINGTGAIIF